MVVGIEIQICGKIKTAATGTTLASVFYFQLLF